MDRAAAESPRPAGLLDLPDETLEQIALCVDQSRDAGSLSRCCRRLRAVMASTGFRTGWLVARHGNRVWRGALGSNRRLLASGTPRDDGPRSVPHGLLAMGFKPPRYLVQEFFAFFAGQRPRARGSRGPAAQGTIETLSDTSDPDEDVASDESTTDEGTADEETNEEGSGDDSGNGSPVESTSGSSGESWHTGSPDEDHSFDDAGIGGSAGAGEAAGADTVSLASSGSSANSDSRLARILRPVRRQMARNPARRPSTAPDPIPSSLSFLREDELSDGETRAARRRRLRDPAVRGSDQVLLVDLLSVASEAYGAAKIALRRSDAADLRVLVELPVEALMDDEGDLAEFDNPQAGAGWLATRRANFEPKRAKVARLVSDYGLALDPPLFSGDNAYRLDDRRQILASLLVQAPDLVAPLLRQKEAKLSPRLVARILFYLFDRVPAPYVRHLFDDPAVRELGFEVTRKVAESVWNSEDGPETSSLLAIVAERMLLAPSPDEGLAPGREVLQGWASDYARGIWDGLRDPVLSRAPTARAALREAVRKNPSLAGELARTYRASDKERSYLEGRQNTVLRCLSSTWPDNGMLGAVQALIPTFGADVAPAFGPFAIPPLPDLTIPRARLVGKLCGRLFRDAPREFYPSPDSDRVLRANDAAHAWLLLACGDRVHPGDQAAYRLREWNEVPPGAGTMCALAAAALERIRGGQPEEEEWPRLAELCEAVVELSAISEDDNGRAEVPVRQDDARKLLDYRLPFGFDRVLRPLHEAALAVVCPQARKLLAKEAERVDSPHLDELFSPEAVEFPASPAEDEEPRLVRSARGAGASQREFDEQTAKEVKWGTKGVGLRRVAWYGTKSIVALSFFLTDSTFVRLGKRVLAAPASGSFLLEPGEQLVRVTGIVRPHERSWAEPAGSIGAIVRMQLHTDRGRMARFGRQEGEVPDARNFTLEPPRVVRRSRAPSPLPGEREGQEGPATPPSPVPPRTILGFSAASEAEASLFDLRAIWKFEQGLDKEPKGKKLRIRVALDDDDI